MMFNTNPKLKQKLLKKSKFLQQENIYLMICQFVWLSESLIGM